MIVLGCMDLDLALREEQPTPLNEKSSTDGKVNMERWDRSNRMSLMIMKRSIPETFRWSMSKEQNALKFLKEIEQHVAKNEKAETSTLLANLFSMKYKGNESIREYIMEMSHIASKLKALKQQLSEDLLVHFVLISLPVEYSKFKVSYNTQKNKWTLSELMSYCVQEEERLKREKVESANLATISKSKKRKKGKEDAVGISQHKEQKKYDEESTCFFCKKIGHKKKECAKYANWRVKKGLPMELITR